MDKYNYDFLCKLNPQLKTKIDSFLNRCLEIDEKDIELYSNANDILEEVIKCCYFESTKIENQQIFYAELLKDYDFRKYLKSLEIDGAFLNKIYLLKDSPYDFFSTDSFLKKEKLIEGVFNILISIYNHSFSEEKVDFISMEQVRLFLIKDGLENNKKQNIVTLSSTTIENFSEKPLQDESFLLPDSCNKANKQLGKNIEEELTEKEAKVTINCEAPEKSADDHLNKENLILLCQNKIFEVFKENGITDLSQANKNICEIIKNDLNLILPNGLTIKRTNHGHSSIESIDLNYSKRYCSGAADNYLSSIRGLISWLLPKRAQKKSPLEKIDYPTPQNDKISSQYLSYYKVITSIIINKYGDDYFFYMKGKNPHLKTQKIPRINDFKEIITKCDKDKELKNKIHVKFSIEDNYAYIEIKEIGLCIYTPKYSKGATKKKYFKISDLIWKFYKLMIQKSEYFPSSMINR